MFREIWTRVVPQATKLGQLCRKQLSGNELFIYLFLAWKSWNEKQKRNWNEYWSHSLAPLLPMALSPRQMWNSKKKKEKKREDFHKSSQFCFDRFFPTKFPLRQKARFVKNYIALRHIRGLRVENKAQTKSRSLHVLSVIHNRMDAVTPSIIFEIKYRFCWFLKVFVVHIPW